MVEIAYPEVNVQSELGARQGTRSPIEVSHLVKVLPLGDGWCVAVGRGHSADPITKDVAVMRASTIARNMGELEVGVYDSNGLVESISISGNC